MSGPIRTAVAAAAAQGVRMQLVHALAAAKVDLLCMASDGLSAYEALERTRPDLLVTDMELPVMEGILLIRRVQNSALAVHPAILMVKYPEIPVPGFDEMQASGVAFVEKPIDDVCFANAIRELEQRQARFSTDRQGRVEELLNTLGFPAHQGRECLKLAVLISSEDERMRYALGKRLYPQVGSLLDISASQAERAMRRAIDLAWQSDKIDNQNRIFADTIDAGRGRPTCGEMIARLADILRLEG